MAVTMFPKKAIDCTFIAARVVEANGEICYHACLSCWRLIRFTLRRLFSVHHLTPSSLSRSNTRTVRELTAFSCAQRRYHHLPARRRIATSLLLKLPTRLSSSEHLKKKPEVSVSVLSTYNWVIKIIKP